MRVQAGRRLDREQAPRALRRAEPRATGTGTTEAAWASLYRTESRPFPPPETGKIAVKVINHYGDEVMKVYDVSP